MKKILPLILLILSANASHAQSKAELKAEALAFSLQVVENYFHGDCEKGFTFYSPEIFTLEGDAPIPIADKKDKYCNSFGKAIRKEGKRFVNYLNDYALSIQYLRKYIKSSNAEIHEDVIIQKDDFMFVGFKQKNHAIENYIWDDMFGFVVRKVNGEWKIVGVSG